MPESLHFPDGDASRLEPHLPAHESVTSEATSTRGRPFVTLTFATSLDSSLSLAPGTRTRLSGPESKAMTHYLRSRHDAILVGVNTVIADDPGLNCRIAGVGLAGQPRPIIVDPRGRWDVTAESKVIQLVKAGEGLAPFVITSREDIDPARRAVLEGCGGKFLTVNAGHDQSGNPRFSWEDILSAIRAQGLQSVMIEGGGQVINSLLAPHNHHLVDSVIVTIAPTWLGQGGVVVSPDRVHDQNGSPLPAARLSEVSWLPLGEDVVLCGKLGQEP